MTIIRFADSGIDADGLHAPAQRDHTRARHH
jgi:hypothetical protein